MRGIATSSTARRSRSTSTSSTACSHRPTPEATENYSSSGRSRLRGHPLAGTDYPWAAGDVRHLAARIVGLLEELGHYRLADGNPADALAAAEQALTLDAYNEAAHQLAMRAESKLGLRQAIVERYESLRHELDTQFGLEPERETRLLYRRLLSQDARVVVPASPVT